MPLGVELSGVVLLALVRVADDVEGRADALELLLGGLVARIGVGMVLLGELAERLAELVVARAPGNAKFLVGVARQECSLRQSEFYGV